MSLKKKIIVINTKYREFGGEDSNIKDELKFLKKYYDVKYLEFDNSKKIKIIDLLGFITINNLSSNKILKKEILTFKPDFAYVHNTWYKANLGIFKILEKNNVRTYLKLHNYRYSCTRFFSIKKHVKKGKICDKCGLNNKGNKIFNKYYSESYIKSFFVILYGKKLFKLIINKEINLLTMNNYHVSFLEDLGVEKGKTTIFYNPLDIESNSTNLYNHQSNYVVYAGRITETKGVAELLDTWAKLNNSDIKLKIVGTGNQLDSLRHQYKQTNIDFLGQKNHEETLNIIKNSKAVITATKLVEGQPRIMCEAAMFGVPIIYPDYGGMSEYFPKSYPLSFKQFDYKDLEKKIYLLSDTNLLKSISYEVFKNIKFILNPNSLYASISKVLTNE